MSQQWRAYSAQWLRRWRLAEMRLLFLALLVSAAAVSSVGFFTDRVEQAMQRQASRILGGDLVLSSTRPLPDSYLEQAQALGLDSSRTVSFRSMILADDELKLVEVKAISDHYPLQGEIESTTALGQLAQNSDQQARLKNGELWAESRLFNELNVAVGAAVQLGDGDFNLSRVLLRDPMQGNNPFQLAPTVLMSLADLAPANLITEASRARYGLQFTGSSNAIAEFKRNLEPQLQASERIQTLEDGVPAVQSAFQRAGRFLGLAALLSVVLAGAAIALSAGSLMRHETRAVAVLKAFGLSRKRIVQDYLSNLMALALIAGLLGAVLGFILQMVLAQWLVNVVDIQLPTPTLGAAWTAILTTLVMVAGFAAPYLLSLVNESPMSILQGGVPLKQTAGRWAALAVLPAIYSLLWLQAGEWHLALWLFVGLLVALVFFWGLSQVFVQGLVHLSFKPRWSWLSVLRQARRSSLLVVVFSVGFFALLLLTALRTDLVGRWQDTLPANAPNYFLINIQPQEAPALASFFQDKAIDADLYPMIRGRLVAINEQAVQPSHYDDERTQRLVEREFNLSSFADLPPSNQILQGQWFNDSTAGFSVEEGIAKDLGVSVGDRMSFDIAGQLYTETVSSLRSVRWDSLEPNFFVIAAPGGLDDKPKTYITSIYVNAEQQDTVPEMIRRFPSITAIDTTAIATQVRSLIDQATFAVQGIFAFTLVTGVLVLLAALQSQKAVRRREMAVLKSLGAQKPLLRRRILTEFLLLGALAGGMAGIMAVLISNGLGYYLFDLGVNINVWLIVLGKIAGALLVGFAAYWNLRGLLQVTPVALLKGG